MRETPFNRMTSRLAAAGRQLRRLLPVTVFLSSAICLTGCALNPKTYDVALPPRVNPEAGPAVRIANAVDRRFKRSAAGHRVKPAEAKERLIGRVPGSSQVTYYAGIFLPERETVAGLAADTVAGGLRSGGYRVLGSGDPGFDTATPLEVLVHSFWISLRHGEPYFEAAVVVRGPVQPFAEEKLFTVSYTGQAKNFFNPIQTTTSNFKPTIRMGLGRLEKDIASWASRTARRP